jgi:Zn-dependent peptidase ImmA (M78 family)
LGHLVLHDGIEVRVDKHFRINLRSSASSKAEDVEEIEANAFAAELLMPRDFLLRDAKKLKLDMEDEKQVSSLAERYDVSRQAMTFRLMNLFGNNN